ncbi:MAG: MinD/ParA family protein [Clostridiales bacterium]|jgi:flagellar biosynthesis protein FlhG|nr:MinD/ParA family protein [Clostridiales bacterium]
MNDQAENLRRAIDGLKKMRMPDLGMAAAAAEAAPVAGRMPRAGPARVFTVTSGKGGVGKTNVSANLAIALSQMGYKVAIIDADFGLANVEVLFGAMPKFKLADAMRSERTIAEIICDGPSGVKFISGGTGVEELVRLDPEQVASLLTGLSDVDMEFDVVIIDTGAGLSDTVLSMSLAADEVILIATPEPTSVTDAYALIKMLSARDRGKTIRLIVNRAETPAEAEEVTAKLAKVAARFLELDLRRLGYILNDPLVVRSVKQQTPFLIGYPKSRASTCTRDIAARLMAGVSPEPDGGGRGLAGFFSRASKLLNMQYKAL